MRRDVNTRVDGTEAMVVRPGLGRRPWGSALLAVAALAFFPSCGGGGGGGGDAGNPGGGPPTFTKSATASATDVITLEGTPVTDNQLQLDVYVGGTTATNVTGFIFDLLLSNSAVVSQVMSSAAGDALSGTVAVSAAKTTGSRITVGVAKQAPSTGNQVSGKKKICTLLLKTAKGTTTVKFVGAPPSTSNTDALVCDDTSATCSTTVGRITTVTYDAQSATITQP